MIVYVAMQQLLDRLAALDATLGETFGVVSAVRRVVELHAPIQVVSHGLDHFIRCPECPGGCDTITDVARELGIETGDHR